MNWFFIIIFSIAVIALVIFLIVSNQKDEKKIEEEGCRNENLTHTISSLKTTLEDSKKGETNTKSKLKALESEFNNTQSEFDIIKQENNKLKIDIQVVSNKSKNFVPYTRLRNTLCNLCKSRVKLAFKEEIMIGNKDRLSLVASVMAEKEKEKNTRASMTGLESEKKQTEKEKACCNLF